MTRPVIICCPTRNELHNLVKLLPAWLHYANHVVIADQMSYDGTREFVSKYENVHLVDNPDADFNERNRIELLVDRARSISSSAALIFLDADETLSANVSNSIEWKSFLNSPIGTTGSFAWISLFDSVKRFNARGSSGRPSFANFGFIDDGRPLEGAGIMHGPRGPGLAKPTRTFRFHEIVNLHFFLTNRDVYRKKQNWYKLFWLRKGGKYFHINRNHTAQDSITIDETDLSPREWFDGFERSGFDLSSTESSSLLWYDVEILKYIASSGTRCLWLLDIWNQDWEHLRQLAKKAGHANIPTEPIRFPPPWILRYTDWTLGRAPMSQIRRSAFRFAQRRLLP